MGAREVYQKTKKPKDIVWNSYVCRPVAAVLVSLVQGTRVTPNQITLSALLVALLACALLIFLPGHQGLILAIVVFELSYVLDCADGMLARFRGTASQAGHLLDFLMDELKAFCVLSAVSVRLFLERDDSRFLLLGLGGLVCLASGIALTTFLRRPEIAGDGSGSARERTGIARLLGLLESGGKFLIHYPSYIWIGAVLDRIEIYFFPYLLVNALYAARTLLQVALRFGRPGRVG